MGYQKIEQYRSCECPLSVQQTSAGAFLQALFWKLLQKLPPGSHWPQDSTMGRGLKVGFNIGQLYCLSKNLELRLSEK